MDLFIISNVEIYLYHSVVHGCHYE